MHFISGRDSISLQLFDDRILAVIAIIALDSRQCRCLYVQAGIPARMTEDNGVDLIIIGEEHDNRLLHAMLAHRCCQFAIRHAIAIPARLGMGYRALPLDQSAIPSRPLFSDRTDARFAAERKSESVADSCGHPHLTAQCHPR